jgi:xanthine dehydrogenase YagR molybdenum-binding subunit
MQAKPQSKLRQAQQPSGPLQSQLVTESKVIGVATPRIEGRLKTTGTTKYSSDFDFPGLLNAWPVTATIASGTVEAIDTAATAKMPGIIAVYTSENIGPPYRVAPRCRNPEREAASA